MLIGSTGLVGVKLITLLEKTRHSLQPVLVSSKKSVASPVKFRGNRLHTQKIPKNFNEFDLVFFCASSSLAKELIPSMLESSCKIIDLSNAFRMSPESALIIPEINGQEISHETQLISSPNCTTTMLLLALYPLHERFQLKKVITSTYQAASGGGRSLLNTLQNETQKCLQDPNFESPIAFNVYPHPQTSTHPDWNLEELKMIQESKKILASPDLQIYPTCIRVPTLRAHSLSVHATFANDIENPEKWIHQAPYLTLKKTLSAKDAENKENVFVSRVRQIDQKTVEMWISGDQLLKGAALNAYQIFEYLIEKNFLPSRVYSPA